MFTTAKHTSVWGEPVGANMPDEPRSVETCSSVTVRLIGHHGAPMAIGAVFETVSMRKFYVMRGR